MGKHWYLDEVYLQSHPSNDVRSVIGMEGYCQIIKSANEQDASAVISPNANQAPSDTVTTDVQETAEQDGGIVAVE